MRPLLAALITGLLATPAFAAPFTVEVDSITDGGPIPMKHAFCEATPEGKSTEGENLRPTIRWNTPPEGTRSLLVVVRDLDVPQDFTDAGKDGKVVKADAPRRLFYHWGLADVPPSTASIPGSPAKEAPKFGVALKTDMADYVKHPSNYGGPCPPWNDERLHRYEYIVYALGVETLKLPANATVADAEKAAAPDVLAEAKVTGTYTLNRALMQ